MVVANGIHCIQSTRALRNRGEINIASSDIQGKAGPTEIPIETRTSRYVHDWQMSMSQRGEIMVTSDLRFLLWHWGPLEKLHWSQGGELDSQLGLLTKGWTRISHWGRGKKILWVSGGRIFWLHWEHKAKKRNSRGKVFLDAFEDFAFRGWNENPECNSI